MIEKGVGAGWAQKSDVELIALVRQHDNEAFAELWRRYYQITRRYASKLDPVQADDLAAQAFLATYEKLTTSDLGPKESFLPYLIMCVRNVKRSWLRKSSQLSYIDDFDDVFVHDESGVHEDREQARDVMDAFRALPTRWQEVLWLHDVEKAGRAAIAEKLGMSPNAVSALYRRAQVGFREQFLQANVPTALRSDVTHVARLLPAHYAAHRVAPLNRPVLSHLKQCSECNKVEMDLRALARKAPSRTFSIVGFAALGAGIASTLPALAPAPAQAAALSTVASGSAGGSSTVAISSTGAAVSAVGPVGTAGGSSIAALTTATGGFSGAQVLAAAASVIAVAAAGTVIAGAVIAPAQAGISDQHTVVSTARPAQSEDGKTGEIGTSQSSGTQPPASETSAGETQQLTPPPAESLTTPAPGGTSPPPPTDPPPLTDPPVERLGIRLYAPPSGNIGSTPPVINGSATAAVSVTVRVTPDGQPSQFHTVGLSDGEWIVDLGPALAGQTGTFTYAAWASDANGNESGAISYSFTLS